MERGNGNSAMITQNTFARNTLLGFLVFFLAFSILFTMPRKAEAIPLIVIVVIVDMNSCSFNVFYGCSGGSGGGSGGGGGGGSSSNTTFSSSASEIFRGEEVTITWDASDAQADSCSGVNFSTGGSVSGSTTVTPDETTTYTLRCSNASGSAESSLTVTVYEPDLSISAEPDRVDRLDTSTITWSADNVDSCAVSEDNPDFNDSWSGVSGSEETSDITAETIYTLTCDVGDLSTSESARVRLIPYYEEF